MKSEITLDNLANFCRYSGNLNHLLEKLGARTILFFDGKDYYEGYVDIDVLLNDNRIFSYKYTYGSCCGCDEWEHRGLTNEEIQKCMETEASYFPDLESYEKWRITAPNRVQ